LRLVATKYLSLDGFFHEPGQWSRPLFNEEAMRFKWAELQTSDAQLNRMVYGGFKVLVAGRPAGLKNCLEER
jgi:hypothetical protein